MAGDPREPLRRASRRCVLGAVLRRRLLPARHARAGPSRPLMAMRRRPGGLGRDHRRHLASGATIACRRLLVPGAGASCAMWLGGLPAAPQYGAGACATRWPAAGRLLVFDRGCHLFAAAASTGSATYVANPTLAGWVAQPTLTGFPFSPVHGARHLFYAGAVAVRQLARCCASASRAAPPEPPDPTPARHGQPPLARSTPAPATTAAPASATARRVAKDSARVTAYGTVDEANSGIGLLLACEHPGRRARPAGAVQHQLFDLGGELCIPGHAAIFDADIDAPGSAAGPLQRRPAAAEGFHPARRRRGRGALPPGPHHRAPRRARTVTLSRHDAVRPQAIRYLNRLSDLLFVLARVLARASGHGEVLWNHDRRTVDGCQAIRCGLHPPRLPGARHRPRPCRTPRAAECGDRCAARRPARRWTGARRRAPRRGQLLRVHTRDLVRAGARHPRRAHAAPGSRHRDVDRLRRGRAARRRRRRGRGGRGAGAARSRAPSARCARPATTPPATRRWASACSTTSPSPPRMRSSAHGLERVAIVDFDVHHGNGTPGHLRARPARAVRQLAPVAAVSGHRAARRNRRRQHRQRAAAAGQPAAKPFRHAWRETLLPAHRRLRAATAAGVGRLRRPSPRSAGRAAAGSRRLSLDHARTGRAGRAACAAAASSPLLEGGYDLAALRECSVAHLDGLG